MKVNVGCGKYVLDGFVNCDIVKHPNAPKEPEILCDARKIPLEDECADYLQAIHVFEHFYYWECPEVLGEWRRLLKPGGVLVLELPDVIKCAQNVISGFTRNPKNPDQMGMWGLYGDPATKDPYMCHRWGWSPKSLKTFLEANGFRDVKHTRTQFHPAGRDQRDMRIEAVKA